MAYQPISGLYDNATNPAPTSNAGIRISQPGYSATNAKDTNLIFDSTWPAMMVVKTFIVPPLSSNVVLTHNLGYPPFARYYVITAPTGTNPFIQGDTNTDFLFPDYITSTTLSLSNGYTSNYIYVECYNIDLSTDVDYPQLPYQSIKTSYDKNFGIKITKDGKGTFSKNPDDYILHSQYRTPLIKAVKTLKTMDTRNGSNTVQYTNNDGVATWNFGFFLVTAATGGGGPRSNAPVGSYIPGSYPLFFRATEIIQSDGITTWIGNGSDNTIPGCLVILRDPLFAPQQVTAVY